MARLVVGVIQSPGNHRGIRPVVPPLWRHGANSRHRGGTTGRLFGYRISVDFVFLRHGAVTLLHEPGVAGEDVDLAGAIFLLSDLPDGVEHW